MIETILNYIGYGIGGYVVVLMTLAGVMAVVQEGKIWAPRPLPSLSPLGMFKVFGLNIAWFTGCFIGVGLVLIKKVLTLGSSDVAKDINTLVEPIVGGAVLKMFVGDVQVVGSENLPPLDLVPSPIYVANHASQIDVAAVYAIQRRFKWIAKQSVVYLPGVGGVMLFGAHVLIQRSGKNKKSVKTLFQKSQEAVESGIPMFFFPQGTRKIAERLPFKDGAFIVAQNSKAPLVPISIEIPRDAWNSMYPFNRLWLSSSRPVVKITIHKMMTVTGEENRETLKKACFDQIYSILPDISEDEKSK
mmetsp:Transcript_5391/g.11001  ORF Transcript_5391/g.11001 Transcript_5391/m.11001 type:complete len:302 (-) Transcript_5391:33-938(-)|eukprot:scaffold291_cov168-Amphora_coffeaeformis.AAC.10